MNAFKVAFKNAGPKILEPIMKVDVTVPNEFQGTVIGNINQRKGTILDSVAESDDVVVTSLLPLSKMFGYSTELRSMTQGKGEFTMEYSSHSAVDSSSQEELLKQFSSS